MKRDQKVHRRGGRTFHASPSNHGQAWTCWSRSVTERILKYHSVGLCSAYCSRPVQTGDYHHCSKSGAICLFHVCRSPLFSLITAFRFCLARSFWCHCMHHKQVLPPLFSTSCATRIFIRLRNSATPAHPTGPCASWMPDEVLGAEMIHAANPQAHRPLVAQHCPL